MEPKFFEYIKFNGFFILSTSVFFVILHINRWFLDLKQWIHEINDEDDSMGRQLVTDGIFLIVWLISTALLFTALWRVGYLRRCSEFQ